MTAGDSRKKKGVYWLQEPERVLGWALFISALLEWTKRANTCRRWAASGIKSPCLPGLISALLLLLMEYDSWLYLLSNYCGMTNHPSVPGAALKALIRPPAGRNWRTISVPKQLQNNAAKKRFGHIFFFSEWFCYERNPINPDVRRYRVPLVAFSSDCTCGGEWSWKRELSNVLQVIRKMTCRTAVPLAMQVATVLCCKNCCKTSIIWMSCLHVQNIFIIMVGYLCACKCTDWVLSFSIWVTVTTLLCIWGRTVIGTFCYRRWLCDP